MQENFRQMQGDNHRIQEDNRRMNNEIRRLQNSQTPDPNSDDSCLLLTYATRPGQEQADQAQLGAQMETRINEIAGRLVVVEEVSGVKQNEKLTSNDSIIKEKLFRR